MTTGLKKFVLGILVGQDPLVDHIIDLMTVRANTVAQHNSNKYHEQALAEGRDSLKSLKMLYDVKRDNVEKAYELVLD